MLLLKKKLVFICLLCLTLNVARGGAVDSLLKKHKQTRTVISILAVDARTNRLIVTAAIDNIVKGAAGQAVQNMNLMCGFPENSGLTQIPMFP